MTTAKSKISKIFVSITLCLMLCVSLFAGCNLIGKDMAKYYNATVASFTYKDTGETVNITKRELITAFNSYGYQYYQNSGDAAMAYKQTATLLVNRKLVVRDAEREAKEENANGEVLTLKQKTYLFEMTYQTATENIVGYYNDMNNITDSTTGDEDSSDGVVAEKDSTPSVQYINGNIVINSTVEDEVESHVYFSDLLKGRDVTKKEDMDALYRLVTDYVNDNPQYTRAFSKYLSDAKTSEKGMKLSTNSEDVFKRELKRIYDALYENFMANKYQQDHQKSNSSVTVSNILEKYKNMVVSDYNKYVTGNASDYDQKVLDDVSKVNYIKPNGTEYFYVTHILAKFDSDQESDYKRYKAAIDGENADPNETTVEENSLDEAKAKVLMEDLYTSRLTFPVRERVEKEDGTFEWVQKSTATLENVINDVQTTLKAAGSDKYARAEAITNLQYKYNQDDGVFNSSRYYTLGIDYNTPDEENGTSYTVRSNMVQQFTDAAVALYNGGAQIGDMYMSDESDIKTGLVRTQFGVHIIFYMGKVENLFEGIDAKFSLKADDIERLASKEARLKLGESKTVFEDIFEKISKSQYSVFESMNLSFLRNSIDDYYYPDAYNDLVKSLK